MILLPFVIITIYVLYLYNQQRSKSLKLKKGVLKLFFFAAMLFWGYLSQQDVSDWLT